MRTRSPHPLRCTAVIVSFLACLLPIHAQSSRTELVFKLNSALKVNHARTVEDCFNFERTDPALAASIRRTIADFSTWPSPVVFATDRKTHEPFVTKMDGKEFTLNGDWTFQIHIHKGPPPSKGFVFPAGRTSSGKFLILLTVPK